MAVMSYRSICVECGENVTPKARELYGYYCPAGNLFCPKCHQNLRALNAGHCRMSTCFFPLCQTKLPVECHGRVNPYSASATLTPEERNERLRVQGDRDHYLDGLAALPLVVPMRGVAWTLEGEVAL